MLQLLLRHVKRVEEGNHVAGLRVHRGAEIGLPPEDAAVVAPAQEIETVIRPARGIVGQHLFPAELPEELLPVRRVDRGGRKVANGLLVGSADLRDRRLGRGNIVFHLVPGHVDTPLDALAGGRHLREVGQLFFVQLAHALL